MLLRAALTCFTKFDRAGLTVFAASLRDAELVRAVSESLPHAVVRFGWIECLTQAGFEVEQTGVPPHHTVWLPDVRPETLEAFEACLEEPVPKP